MIRTRLLMVVNGCILLLLLIALVGCGPFSSGLGAPATQITPLALPSRTTTPTTPTPPPTSSTDWTTYHRDNARTGYLANAPDAHQLTRDWNTRLDGAVYAEPLVINGSVIVATEGNSLYSLDARTGKVQWSTNVGSPVPLSSLPCGNIDPLGITGTPVYDPATRLIFAVAEIAGPRHILVGVDARTGQVRVRCVADPSGIEVTPHQQRAALALSMGKVYIAYGGLGRRLWKLSRVGRRLAHRWTGTIAHIRGSNSTRGWYLGSLRTSRRHQWPSLRRCGKWCSNAEPLGSH